MAEGKTYKIDITQPAKRRYQSTILPYIFENFSLERALEVDDNILNKAQTLNKKPNRGTKEKHLREAEKDFKFILHQETKHFEIKIVYYISEEENTVYITDFFPTKMHPEKINK